MQQGGIGMSSFFRKLPRRSILFIFCIGLLNLCATVFAGEILKIGGSHQLFSPLFSQDEGAKSEKIPVPDRFRRCRSSHPVPSLYEQESPPNT